MKPRIQTFGSLPEAESYIVENNLVGKVKPRKVLARWRLVTNPSDTVTRSLAMTLIRTVLYQHGSRGPALHTEAARIWKMAATKSTRRRR